MKQNIFFLLTIFLILIFNISAMEEPEKKEYSTLIINKFNNLLYTLEYHNELYKQRYPNKKSINTEEIDKLKKQYLDVFATQYQRSIPDFSIYEKDAQEYLILVKTEQWQDKIRDIKAEILKIEKKENGPLTELCIKFVQAQEPLTHK